MAKSTDTLIEPPIIQVADDIELFDSIAAAERHMESWQVPDTRVFDSAGRLLNLGTREWTPDPLVTIGPGETEPSHAEELKALLAGWSGVDSSRGSRLTGGSDHFSSEGTGLPRASSFAPDFDRLWRRLAGGAARIRPAA